MKLRHLKRRKPRRERHINRWRPTGFYLNRGHLLTDLFPMEIGTWEGFRFIETPYIGLDQLRAVAESMEPLHQAPNPDGSFTMLVM